MSVFDVADRASTAVVQWCEGSVSRAAFAIVVGSIAATALLVALIYAAVSAFVDDGPDVRCADGTELVVGYEGIPGKGGHDVYVCRFPQR